MMIEYTRRAIHFLYRIYFDHYLYNNNISIYDKKVFKKITAHIDTNTLILYYSLIAEVYN